MRTRDRKDAEIVTIATGLLLGLAVAVVGVVVLGVLRHTLGVGDDVIEPLFTGVLVTAMVVAADHVHRQRRG
ncbi:hypothetical protein [Nocardioides taihuensis]|uniref:Uncharacterized protein n=1 Tax=Nocardioides taihuensis TaxID=1835606 RepID=A0ABW0BEP5_9ACTN